MTRGFDLENIAYHLVHRYCQAELLELKLEDDSYHPIEPLDAGNSLRDTIRQI
jgi:hypothetical protein